MSENIQRKLIVCLRNKCRLCNVSVNIVPLACKYDVLHVLENSENLQERPRQSGKTTELVGLANEIVELGYLTYFITRTHDMGEHLKGLLNPAVKMITLAQVQRGFARGFSPGFILADEIRKEELPVVQSTMIGSQLVAAYCTPFLTIF